MYRRYEDKKREVEDSERNVEEKEEEEPQDQRSHRLRRRTPLSLPPLSLPPSNRCLSEAPAKTRQRRRGEEAQEPPLQLGSVAPGNLAAVRKACYCHRRRCSAAACNPLRGHVTNDAEAGGETLG